MLLSAIDPDLLIYNYEEWQANARHCYSRWEALTLHRSMIRKYDQEIALSKAFAAFIYQSFPWHKDYRCIEQLRDLRQFILIELPKAHWIKTKADAEVELQPIGIVCQCVASRELVNTWKNLLCGCIDEANSTECVTQIATWETSGLREKSIPNSLTIIITAEGERTQIHHIPLIWDKNGWYMQLVTQDWGRNLQRRVDLEFKTNPGMRNFDEVRDQPIPFECTEEFWKSLDRYCKDKDLFYLLIKALTKKVHGICDASLGDEPFGKRRRFRVKDFWRVHYREENGRIVLEEFGPHSIGSVD